MLKYNANDEYEWGTVTGVNSDSTISDIIETSDGGFLVGGTFINVSSIDFGNNVIINNHGYYDGMVIKYNSVGEAEWAYSAGGSKIDRISCVCELKNGKYLVGGYFQSSSASIGNDIVVMNNHNTDNYDVMLIQINSDGTIDWGVSLGGNGDDSISKLKETEDGGYFLSGSFSSTNIGNGITLPKTGTVLIKNNSESNYEWSIIPEGSVNQIIETMDDCYMIVGYQTGTKDGKAFQNGMIKKYDRLGNLLIEKKLLNSISCVLEVSRGEYLIGGSLNKYYCPQLELENGTIIEHKYRNTEALLVRIEEEFFFEPVIKEGISIGEEYSERINSVIETGDGGFLIGGSFSSSTLDLNNGNVLNNHGSTSYLDGMVAKYDKNNLCEWGLSLGGNNEDCINNVIETKDEGYLLSGYFNSNNIDLENDITIRNHGNTNYSDGMIIKCDREGKIEWGTSIGGTGYDCIKSAIETEDGGFIIGGYFASESIDFGDEIIVYNHGSTNYDGILVKYNRNGRVEWAKSIGEAGSEYINSITETKDGGYLVAGYFYSSNIDLGNDITISNHGSNGYSDGFVIKYNRWGETEWAKSIGGDTRSEYINSIIETKDGGYLVAGYFYSSNIDLGNDITISNHGSTSYSDGLIIKYDREGNAIWGTSIGGTLNDVINSIFETGNSEYLVVGYFSGSIELEKEKNIISNGKEDGMLIKCDEEGKIEWAKNIGGTENDRLSSVAATKDEEYLIGGYFNSSKIEFEDGISLDNFEGSNNYNGMVLKAISVGGVLEQEVLTVNNTIKKFILTTDINEIDGIKGGTISGENNDPYEIVKYGEDSTKEIKMIPDENYEIIGITVNGEEWQYEPEVDGSYIMPQFTNITEDKHVVVTYSLKDNRITINKEDSVSGEKLEGAQFKLDQIEERTDPIESEIIGDLVDNGQTYLEGDTDNEITGKFGVLTNNGTYYFVENEDGSYIPTNGKTWRIANVEGATGGVNYSTANSYIPIDLTDLDGEYVVVLNAICSYYYAYGYATITETTTAPSYSSSTGRFIYNYYYANTADYTSMKLQGGKTYYLHLGYYRQSSTYYEDQLRINSIKLYKAKESVYNFTVNDGKYESTNEGKDNTVCNSYIPIDLSCYTGKYNLTVNANVSSQSNYDYGYATITENTNRVAYNTSTGRFIYISGTVNEIDYTTVLNGGKTYYLHLGYFKNVNTSTGNDKFTINSIHLSLNDSELYHVTVTSNSEGQAITQIPFGKYEVTEIKSPEGYYLNEEPIIIEFRSTEGAEHEFTITNDKIGKTIVHHYIKDTTTSLAEDDIFTGRIKQEGETIPNDELDEYSYNSVPHMDFDKYELEKDVDGEYITPNNANGFFTYEDTIVTYFYVPKQIPLTVHHYIEGTTSPVLLTNGEEAEDEVRSGSEGEEYNTEPISEEELNEKYELIEIPENAEGTYEYNENIVTYYYKIKTFNVKTSVEPHEEIDLLGQTVSVKGGTISGENKETYETIIYGEDSIKEVKAMPDSGYEVKGITINNEPIDFTEEPDRSVILNKFIGVKENKNVVVLFGAAQGTVKVNHYLENTEERITDLDGNTVEQEVKTGTIGDIFATKEREDLLCKYELVSVPNVTSGQYGDEEQIFNYYYKIKEFSYEVNYLLKDDDTDDTNNESIHDPKTSDAIYHYGDTIDPLDEKIEIEGYKYDSTNIDTTLAIGEGENIINIYYIIDEDNTKERKYIVEYYISGDKQNDDTDEVKEIVQVLQPNTLEVRKDDINIVDKYEGYKLEKILLNDNEEPLEGLPDTVNSGDVIKVYYTFDDTQKREIKYTVEYYKDGELQEDTQTERKLVHVLDGDTLEVDQTKINTVDKYEGYTFEKTIPARIPSIVIDGDTIQVYYVKTKYPYRVEYYYNNVKDDAATETGEAYKEDRIENYTPKPKEGYEFEKVEKIPLTISDTEPNVIKVYYLPIRNITVKHIDKNTGEVLETEEKHGKQGYTVTTTAKDIDDYMLVERPDTEEYTYTEADQEVVYYYAKVSSGVLEKHLDLITGDPIVEDVLYEGYEGKPYQTSSKEIDGYYVSTNKELYESIVKENPEFLSDAGYESLVDFFEDKGIVGTDEFIPEDAEGEMEEGLITVRYYYTPIMKLIVKYKDILTGEEILETIEGEQVDSTVNETGSLNEAYNTTSKTFENYLNVSNKKYYKWYLTNHPEELEEAGVETVEEYLEQENIDPKAPYVPDNSEGIYEVVLNDDGTYSNEIHVTYYYAPEREVTIKYYDKTTGEEICEEVIKIGPDGDEYDVTEDKKEIEGYTLIEEPENPEGIYEENNTPRIFRYAKNTQVIVKYVDKETRESIDETENYKIEGYEGKAYETEQKEFNDYEYEEVEGDVEGTMPRDTIQVIYYYSRTSTPIDNTITNEINNNTVTNDVINNTITNDISNNTITNEIVNNTVNNTTNTNTTNTIKVTNTVTNTTKTTNTTKDSVIKRIINPKTGDIVPVVAYSTIFIVLFVNLMLARYKRAELEKYKRVSRISKTSIEEKNKKAKH